MAVPLFILSNSKEKTYKRRTFLENLSDFEVRKHCGLPWTAARDIFDWLEPEFGPEKNKNHAVAVETKILTALSFFRSGSFQWIMGTVSGTSQPSCSRIVELATNVLTNLAKDVIKFPDDLTSTKEAYYKVGGIPNIIGCVDGSHVELTAPREGEPAFVNRYQTHSINAQVVGNHKNYICDLVSKWPGSTHDAFIWSQCSLRRRFQQGAFGDSCLIGDTGYPSELWLQVPFQRNLNSSRMAYNCAHKKTRNSIERTIGVWKSRFRCIHISGGVLCYNPAKVCRIIVSTAVLHNFCISKNIELVAEDEDFFQNVVLPQIRESNDEN